MQRGGECQVAFRMAGACRKTWGLLGTGAVWGLLAAGPVLAAPQEPPREQVAQAGSRSFDIPAQPLAGALTAFGVQSGLQISVDTAILSGLRSPGVKGAQTPERGLTALLSGTGMVWRFSAANTVVVERGAADGAMVLDTITVAGERVERSLMETASSVSVLESKTIDSQPSLTGTNAAVEGIPNVVAIDPGNHAPIIRGVEGSGAATGATAFFAGARPRLTTQIDGRPVAFHEMIFGDTSLWDVEQVEVFRGPQSTVQGRNSIAGAIVVKTKDPTYTPEGKVRTILGNHDSRQFSGMISGPIIEDQLAVRMAVDRSTSISELEFQGYAGNADPENYQSTNLRAKMLIEPRKLEGFRTMLTLNHTDYEGPAAEYVKRPFEDGVAYGPQVATFNPRTTSGIVDTTWEMTDALTLENRFSLTDISVRRHVPPASGNVEIDGREAVLEPRLRFTAPDQRLTGFGGYYGLRAKQNEYIDLYGGNRFDDKTETNAVFGEATLAIDDAFDLTAGARLEQEDRHRVGGTGNYAVNFDETYKAFLPKVGLAWHADDAVTLGTMVSRGYNGGGAGITFSAPFVSYTYEPEYVWNYETYARADLLGGKLRLTGNVFYADYKNLQLPFQLAASSVVIRNAREAATYGSEVGARWLAMPGVELFAEIGLLKTEIKNYPGSGFEGNDLPHAPALTGTLGANYRPLNEVELGADARYSEAYYSDAANTPRGKTDPYWVVNIHASYDFGGARVFTYVKNLLDTDTPLDILTPRTDESFDQATMLKPRTFGLGVEMSF